MNGFWIANQGVIARRRSGGGPTPVYSENFNETGVPTSHTWETVVSAPDYDSTTYSFTDTGSSESMFVTGGLFGTDQGSKLTLDSHVGKEMTVFGQIIFDDIPNQDRVEPFLVIRDTADVSKAFVSIDTDGSTPTNGVFIVNGVSGSAVLRNTEYWFKFTINVTTGDVNWYIGTTPTVSLDISTTVSTGSNDINNFLFIGKRGMNPVYGKLEFYDSII